MAKDKRGTKRQCEHCGMKYYDLNKDPILCPGCGEPYVEPAEPTPRKTKAKMAEPKVEETAPREVEADPAAKEAGVETVSFEEAETDNDADADSTEENIPDAETVADIGGEVDNSFVDDEDDEGAQNNYGLNTAKDDE